MGSPDIRRSENEISHFGRSAKGGEKGDFVKSLFKKVAKYDCVFFISGIVVLINNTIIV